MLYPAVFNSRSPAGEPRVCEKVNFAKRKLISAGTGGGARGRNSRETSDQRPLSLLCGGKILRSILVSGVQHYNVLFVLAYGTALLAP